MDIRLKLLRLRRYDWHDREDRAVVAGEVGRFYCARPLEGTQPGRIIGADEVDL